VLLIDGKLMIPSFDSTGNLPAGIHWASWNEIADRFGGTPHRQRLLDGLLSALKALSSARCETVYIDGSFVTAKATPGDFDACWSVLNVDADRLDPVLLDFANVRAAQKRKYLGELFPAEWPEAASGKTWLGYFQTTKETGQPKGIVAIDLRIFP
jgi:hypothetical protein